MNCMTKFSRFNYIPQIIISFSSKSLGKCSTFCFSNEILSFQVLCKQASGFIGDFNARRLSLARDLNKQRLESPLCHLYVGPTFDLDVMKEIAYYISYLNNKNSLMQTDRTKVKKIAQAIAANCENLVICWEFSI